MKKITKKEFNSTIKNCYNIEYEIIEENSDDKHVEFIVKGDVKNMSTNNSKQNEILSILQKLVTDFSEMKEKFSVMEQKVDKLVNDITELKQDVKILKREAKKHGWDLSPDGDK